MRELSIFCDESGDFGPPSTHSPYYLVSLVLHDQGRPIDDQVRRFNSEMRSRQLEGFLPVHTAPLIRREERYRDAPGADRKRAFDVLFAFARRCGVYYKTLVIDKRVFGGDQLLERRIAREMGQFIRDNLGFFQAFDKVILYYDRGQKEISRTLDLVLSSTLFHVEFRTVSPEDYVLFQVADLACTIELIEAKRVGQGSGLTRSEEAFFGGSARFKKNYAKVFREMRFEGAHRRTSS